MRKRKKQFKGRPPEARLCLVCGDPFAQDLKMTKRRFCDTCRKRRDLLSDARAAARYRAKMKSMTPKELESRKQRKPEWSGDWDRM